VSLIISAFGSDLGRLGNAKLFPEQRVVILAAVHDVDLGIAAAFLVPHLLCHFKTLTLLHPAGTLAIPLEDVATSVEDEDVAFVHALHVKGYLGNRQWYGPK